MLQKSTFDFTILPVGYNLKKPKWTNILNTMLNGLIMELKPSGMSGRVLARIAGVP
jgi:hypothetical protein